MVVALLAAFGIAVAATPAGISGAVLLLPFQVSVLGTPSPAVTPTNLLYNVIATPGALYRYRRQHQTGGRLALLLTGGTVPGVIAGSVIRVELIPGPRIFDLVVSAVLLPLGAWLTATGPAAADRPGPAASHSLPGPDRAGLPGRLRRRHLWHRRWLHPVPGPDRRRRCPAADVAPAALASTFVTSIAGVATFTILAVHHPGSVAPDWPTGVALGLGGLAGGYTGARIQARLPDTLIRRIVGVLIIAIGARYLWSGLS